jgi:TRAP-type C4-dicarboxylate transport system permease small subunit
MESIIQRLIKYGTAIAGVVMIGVLILIAVTALARLAGFMIPGTFDVVETFMMIVGAFCVAYCESQDAQAKAEVITSRVSSRTRSCLAIVTTLLGTFYWGVIFYAGWRMLAEKYRLGERTDLLQVNVVPSRTMWVLALALICLFLFSKLLHHIKDAVKGPDKGSLTTPEGVSK